MVTVENRRCCAAALTVACVLCGQGCSGSSSQPIDARVFDASPVDASAIDTSAVDVKPSGDVGGDNSIPDAKPDTHVKCASRANEAMCLDNCGSGEVCFTQVICGPSPQGETACSVGPGTAGDDQCHRECTSDSECGVGEACVRYQFFGCSNFNGGPAGRGICCRGDGGCG